MIKIDRVELLHWDMQHHQVLPLSGGVTLITGENGSGKTSILDAIKAGLGVTRFPGERSIDEYLCVQARPVAMVRILVDNRPEPGTRRRPFDPLGEHSEDVITLAVVFRAGDKSHYRRDYFILDGDVVPLSNGVAKGRTSKHRPLPGVTAYRERLHKVGIGDQYRKLLRLPQGQIASFCKEDGSELFDSLYDIIGGRSVLEKWKAERQKLTEKKREAEEARSEVQGARRELEILRHKVRRYEEYSQTKSRLDAVAAAIPHSRVLDARRRSEELDAECEAVDQKLKRSAKTARDAAGEEKQFRRELENLDKHRQKGRTKRAELEDNKDEVYQRLAEARASFEQLEKLRRKTVNITRRDLDELERKKEQKAAELAGGQARQQQRDRRRADLEHRLEQVKEGILPYPEEVDAFRTELRKKGIPHHLLAEVLEVDDDASEWTESVEAFLGRYRFAVLVQDPKSWEEAALLSREFGYPHGVLAPDVRSWSPADDEGLGAVVRVREKRYRQLVARLLRRVRPGEPPRPLEPPPRDERHLAPDGFVVSRIEARFPQTDRTYLGRRALKQRRSELEEAIEEIEEETKRWNAEEKRLRDGLAKLDEAIERQNRLRQWEKQRDEHAQVRETIASLEEKYGFLKSRLQRLTAELDDCQDRWTEVREHLAQLEEQINTAGERREELAAKLKRLRKEKEVADADLGELLAEPPGEPSAEVAKVLAEGDSFQTLRARREELEKQLRAYDDDARDEMVRVNYERQRGEVDAVVSRLERLEEELEEIGEAAREAEEHYHQTTRRIFRTYFNELARAAQAIDFTVQGKLQPRAGGRFSCDIRVKVGDKPAVHHDSDKLSGGEKAALSILMGMTAVSLEREGAGFFLIDEPFSQSDMHKINELGRFLAKTEAQYLVSMPTTADLGRCGMWLEAVWTCTRCRGGYDEDGDVVLAPPVKLSFAEGARDG